jgi:hypothetical protein
MCGWSRAPTRAWGRARFVEEARPRTGTRRGARAGRGGPVVAQELERHGATEALVAREPDGPHAAGAEPPLDAVRPHARVGARPSGIEPAGAARPAGAAGTEHPEQVTGPGVGVEQRGELARGLGRLARELAQSLGAARRRQLGQLAGQRRERGTERCGHG